MSWFWGKTDTAKPDATSALDPSLRAFLDKPKPSTQSTVSAAETPSYREQVGLVRPESTSKRTATDVASRDSETGRGRYADLWKNYKPLEQLEAENKTDQEKLRDLVDHVQDQKHAVGRTARENCTFEEINYNRCLASGSITSRMTMCKDEQRKQIRCFEMQQKFLKALGYMNLVNRKDISIEEETQRREQIQMHADNLYRQMLARERAKEAAKQSGQDLSPHQAPLVTPSQIEELNPDNYLNRDSRQLASALGVETTNEHVEPTDRSEGIFARARDTVAGWISPAPPDMTHLDLSDLPVSVRQHFVERIGDRYSKGEVSQEELAVEKEAFKAEVLNDRDLALGWLSLREQEKIARAKRWEEGKQTIGDRMKRMGGKE